MNHKLAAKAGRFEEEENTQYVRIVSQGWHEVLITKVEEATEEKAYDQVVGKIIDKKDPDYGQHISDFWTADENRQSFTNDQKRTNTCFFCCGMDLSKMKDGTVTLDMLVGKTLAVNVDHYTDKQGRTKTQITGYRKTSLTPDDVEVEKSEDTDDTPF